jgi:hypothetical protein
MVSIANDLQLVTDSAFSEVRPISSSCVKNHIGLGTSKIKLRFARLVDLDKANVVLNQSRIYTQYRCSVG